MLDGLTGDARKKCEADEWFGISTVLSQTHISFKHFHISTSPTLPSPNLWRLVALAEEENSSRRSEVSSGGRYLSKEVSLKADRGVRRRISIGIGRILRERLHAWRLIEYAGISSYLMTKQQALT